MLSSSLSSSHMALSVTFSYGAPPGPVSELKYRMVGQPPAPGLKLTPCRSLIGFSDRLTSPNTTSLLSLNAERAAPHPDDCLTHQPQPSDAIQRTIAVLPALRASLMKESNVASVSLI